jgi:voltage-gated potassium channel
MQKTIPKSFILAFTLACLIFVVGTAGYMLIDNYTFINAIYMTVITIATVGYGEIQPLSTAGRIFTMFLILGGFGVLTYVIMSGISFLLEGNLESILRRRKMEKLLEELKDHHIICASGEIGEYIIEEFVKTKKPIVVVTTDNFLLEKLSFMEIPVVNGNPAEDEHLIQAGISKAKGLVTALGDDKFNLFVVLTAKSLNPQIKVISQTIEKHSAIKMKKAGADDVVLTDQIGAMRIASAMLRPTVVSFLDGMLKNAGEALRVEEATVTGKSDLADKTLQECKIQDKTGLLVLAVKDAITGKYLYNPQGNYRLKTNDVIIVVGSPQQVSSLNNLTGSL